MMQRMNNETGKTVFVGLSGGVDSSVAAARLKARGFDVVGVFIKVWHPDFMVCNWEQERLDAMRVAAHLDIPFLTCDAEAEYRDDVAKYFIEEYKAGRTPNPDVMCNQHVKFGAFLSFAKEKGADFIATGHYAQNMDNEMHRGVDGNKDQTYFLWTLSNEQLEQSLFPVGDTPKEDIRKEAEAAGIPVAEKKDSQGICFLGHVDIPEFLSHYIDLEHGDVLNTEGEVVGTHQGAFVYTLGQRHGFTLNTHDTERTPMFVVDKDIEANTITIGPKVPVTQKDDIITLNNLVLRAPVSVGDTFEAQFRYRQAPFEVSAVEKAESKLVISMARETDQPAVGQSCVLYKGSLCLGGGRIG
tara:strand:+ start:6486 stop:7553 length:1068 start_codon:yes stop_codon:yes gene_type:complete